MLSHTPPQLARGGLLSPVLLHALPDANCQPGILGGSVRRPRGTIHRRETAPWLAYGNCEHCLPVLLRLQHRPLGDPAGQFNPLDAAQHSASSAFLVVVRGIVGGLWPGDGFLDDRPGRARRGVGLPPNAQSCARPPPPLACCPSYGPAPARPSPVSRAGRRNGGRRAVLSRGLRASLRPARPGSDSPAHCSRTPAQSF